MSEKPTIEDLGKIFRLKVLPLLEEYFHGDLGRVGLVLGKAFVEEVGKDNKVSLMSFAHDMRDEYGERKVYRLLYNKEWSEEDFINIYQPRPE